MMNKNTRSQFVAALLMVLSMLVQAAVAAPSKTPALVSVQDGLLTVHDNEANLLDILTAAAHQAGFEVIIRGELESPPVRRQIIAMPLDQGLRSLLGEVNSVLVYENTGSERRIREVRVFGSGKIKSVQRLSKPVRKHVSEWDKDSLRQELQQPEPTVRLYALNQIAQLPEADALALLRELLQQDADYQVRLRAIELLGEIGSVGALDVLQLGLADTDAKIRVETINTLSFIAGEDAIPVLGQMLFNETDIAVRQHAIETIALQPQSDAVQAFLHVATRDTNRTIREFAALNLAAWN